MAYGDYYNPATKVVVDGNIVHAADINAINSAVDSGFSSVASDLDALEASVGDAVYVWATEDQGVRPDPDIAEYSAKAYALEAKGWAVSAGEVLEASTGLALAGSVSAKTSATSAASSASTATTQAGIATTQAGIATTQAGTAITQAGNAASSASAALGYKNDALAAQGAAEDAAELAEKWAVEEEDVVVDGGKYSAYHWAQKAQAISNLGDSLVAIGLLTPSAGTFPYYTGVDAAALGTITAQGLAILDDANAAAQKTTIGLGNVPNVDCTNASNISSGTLAEARIDSSITRDSEVNTATQAALDLKANLVSPTFTGTPTAPTAAVNTNTTQIATTAYYVGQAATNAPQAAGAAAVVGTSYKFAREDHVHIQDSSKADLASPVFTGTPTAPTQTVGNSSTRLATTAFVLNQGADTDPIMDGSAAKGTSTRYARQDHVHPSDTTKQDALVSGTSIKTVGGASLLGSGNIAVPNISLAPDAVGSIVFATPGTSSVAILPGDTIAGSLLEPACVAAIGPSGLFSGTWRCLGYVKHSIAADNSTTLWQRIL